MGVLIRFRSTRPRGGRLVHFRDATSYAVMRDNTVQLLDRGRNVGAVHSERWESVQLVEPDTPVEERYGPVERA